ncbi:MAG: hypothetical protein KA965_03625 [Butyrivibrio sp.]|nr:hypothetical protein [Butyrivibrio sp.]
MDNFMDKLAQKLSAQEMIKANAAAEAAETERLRIQVARYQTEMEEIRKGAADMTDQIRHLEEIIQNNAGKTDTDSCQKIMEQISEIVSVSDTNTHDVGVRVYRNVQACVQDEQKKQTQELEKTWKETTDSAENKLVAMIQTLSENAKKADLNTAEQLKEMQRQLETLQIAIERKNAGLLPAAVFTLLTSAAGLVLIIMRIMGIL